MKNSILVLLCTAVVVWSGCSSAPKALNEPPQPAEELYREAMSLFVRGNYIDSYAIFQKCRSRYPINEWGIKSELKVADCQYFQKQYATALIQYQEFARLHPTYEYSDYVQYQIGMCSYKQLCTIDRDQSFARNGAKQFERFISLFPGSPYVPSAMEKLEECKRRIAEHVLYIANYYYKTGAYPSALRRYQEARESHFEYLARPDLLILQQGKTYLRLNDPDRARDEFILLVKNYPESPYAVQAQDLLEDAEKIKEMDKVKATGIFGELNPFNDEE
ncbi:MAG TPA: outer membrane protein assembly factor BamD [Thermodesulfobacteriota bacterium]|nr:outer membrane protein assembly factor BamD [Deltaproteobacteria bacterium]HNR12432.1 outer membrane protein assembly factor BamD [Thermodesulfobacteriota bacterium]HNU70460.1 outer membrane protein assembly factor BamD [Thermodesulfobacteriota bacterium]HOC38765.1 outer membrane protein assembly factor BamD [Thermodesulfobacteriota bacterium]HQO77858.1 outer membrane protein assembly factor BamD [Thermodesulfobacteriota bacterium]